MNTEQLGLPFGSFGSSSSCLAVPIVGKPARVDASGTHLARTLRSAVLDAWPAVRGGVTVLVNGWHLDIDAAAPAAWIRQLVLQCSATLLEDERPTTVDYFTPATSEWVSAFTLDSPPVFVDHQPAAVATPRTENIGTETVMWLRDLLGLTQERACRAGHVSVPTFYLWRKKPDSIVRPATIADGLRLRSTLELAISRLGREDLVRILKSGSPSLLDQLMAEETWEGVVATIAALGQPAITSPAARGGEVEDYLERLDQLDDSPSSEGRVILGAEQMTPDQVADAERLAWGDGER